MRHARFLSVFGVFCLSLVPTVPGRVHAAGSNSPVAVWGQPDFVSGTCRSATTRTLCGPAQVARDHAGNLWVADLANNRVVMYPPGSSIATKVFGQYGSFTTSGCNQPPPAARAYPAGP